MATLQNIRNKGPLLVIVIGVALLAFVLGDLFSSGSLLVGKARDRAFVVNGEVITTQEYSNKITEFEEFQKMISGQSSLDENISLQIREAVYQQMVRDRLLKDQADDLGLVVTKEEINDLVYGQSVSPILQQLPFFVDPQTGIFSRTALVEFLNVINTPNPNPQEQALVDQYKSLWLFIENMIKTQRLEEKYISLLSNSVIVNDLEAKRTFDLSQQNAEIEYVMKSYFTVPDSSVTVTDKEIRDFYNKNKKSFKLEAPIVKISYFTKEIVPSDEDFAAIEQQSHTACKVYSELIGNIQRDCNSARKYWHFIKVMGRSASHIALECALQTHPNVCIISEEVEQKGLSLDDIIEYIAGVIAKRAENGLNFGTVIIPEGLIEFIPAMKNLISELNDFLAHNQEEFDLVRRSGKREYIISKLSPENSEIYASLPETVARQLTLDRDPHGNVQVSLIETEKLLTEMVSKKLSDWAKEGKYKGKFASITHFFGYEGRCAAPSNYDADYCYSLGYTASMLVASGKTGYMSSVKNTTAPAAEWVAGGVPITMMLNLERRHGEMKPVIQKALVKLDGAPFLYYKEKREEWAIHTDYVYPGPIQYFGPTEVCDQPSKTLQLEQTGKITF
jgi:6-phosphofructokinase